MTKKCPRCKIEKSEWNRNVTYCKPCTKILTKDKRDRAHDKIMKATDNGRAWWVLQWINAQQHYRKED